MEAGLTAKPWEYGWSSARAYALGQTDALLAENGEYLALAQDAVRRQELWREFLMKEDPVEEAVRREDWAIGDDEFRRRMLQQQGRPARRQRGRPPKRAAETGII